MIPGMNPRDMQKMLKQLGVKSEDVAAERVVVEKTDGTRLVVENPSVTIVEMQGQKTLQVTGDFREAAEASESEKPAAGGKSSASGGEGMTEINDSEMVMRETGASREEAEEALREANGDLADAILKLEERGKRK
ncbi:Nascent polypeptide-associated complex protein [Candidatus Micrarchaeota archaeon]|nr:Nascent polypeptide-associated complex protein [Candidatus Micrarchaeota archaeon]